MNKRNFLIKESLKKKLKSKWFIGINIFIFLMILITINLNSIISLFGGDFKEEYTIYVKDELNVYEDFKKNFNNNNIYFSDTYTVENKSSYSIDKLKDEALNNKNIIILEIKRDDENYIQAETYSNKEISSLINSAIQSSLKTIKYNFAIEHSIISKEELEKINSGVVLKSNILVKEQVEIPQNEKIKNDTQRSVMGAIVVVAFILPFFFLIVTLVQMIGAEINEEKTNKSMEIIISNVRPKDHLVSKIVSCTSFTIIQILLIVLYFFIASLFKGHSNVSTGTGSVLMEAVKDIITPDVIQPIIRIIPLLVIFFIFTLITYAIIAGVLASITTSIDDFQQLQTPLMLIISLAFYLSIMAVIFEKSKFIILMSYIPLISFLLSPSLYMLNQISIISLIISIIIQIIFCVITYKYGLRIYKEGILNYSGTNLWRKLFRSIKK